MSSTRRFLALLFAVGVTAVNVRTSTPPMGWNSYNHYSCYATEDIILANAQALIDLGLADLGYNYVVPDCGWSSKNRTAEGKITWNETFYPSGYPALIEKVHDLGLKFGIYSGAGTWECHPLGAAYLIQASLGHEQSDAETFSEWGGDYLKYDNCWADGKTNVNYYPDEADPSTRFRAMADALDTVERDIVYGICQWGIGNDLAEWAGKIGNSWRMSNDITDAWNSIYRIANQVVPLAKFSSPGHYNDMDMLMVGNGVLTEEESKTHFTIWCISKSPLVIGAAVESNLLDSTSLTIISNPELIAINQDALGTAAELMRRFSEEEYDIWAGNLSDSRTVLAIVNWAGTAKTITIDLPDARIQSAGSARDVWEAEDLGAINGIYEAEMPGHGVKLLVLGDTVPAGVYTISTYDQNLSTSTFPNVYALSSSLYTLLVTSSSSSSGSRTITITTGNTTQTLLVTGQTYTIPSIPLPAGQNTITINDPSGAIDSFTLTEATDSQFYAASNATLSGSASVYSCSGACLPTNSKIVNLDTSSTVTFSNVDGGSVPGSKFVYVDYINYELSFDLSWSGVGVNIRNFTFTVNDVFEKEWAFPISGGDWYETGRMGVLLEGFVEGESNVIVVSVPGWDYGPDLVGLEVLV
ncbi:hypothetical protein RUND412_004441 [Rhizina undulata]